MKVMRRFGLLWGLSTVILAMFAPTASAYYRSYWCGGPNQAGNYQNYSGGYCVGYFYGGHASGTSGSDLIAGGVRGDINGFKTDINNALGAGGSQQMGASMVIDVMMNASHSLRVQSGTEYNRWTALVDKYNSGNYAGYGIDWNSSADCYKNSAYASDIGDDVFHRNIDQCGDPAIRFYWPGGGLYIIKSCGNLTGDVSLPNPPDKWFMNGSSAVTIVGPVSGQPTGAVTGNVNVFPGQTVIFDHNVWNSGPDATSGNVNGSVHPVALGIGYNQRFSAGWSNRWSNSNNHTFPSNAAVGTQYCEDVDWAPNNWNDSTRKTSTKACATVVSPPNVKPIVSVTPGPVERGSTVTATGTIHNGTGYGAQVTNVSWVVWLSTSASSSNPPETSPVGTDLIVPGGSGSPGTMSVPNGGTPVFNVSYNIPQPPAAMQYNWVCARLYIHSGQFTTVSGGNITPPSDQKTVAEQVTCVQIVSKPFFVVKNGDLNAAMASGVPAAGSGAIKAFNKNNAPAYDGSKVSIAAFAAGPIDQLASSWGTGGANLPKYLTFANDASAGSWGGNSTAAITDSIDQTDFITANTSGVGGPVTIGTQTIPAGTQTVTYVKGDVYITGNITYAGSFSVSSIPLFKVVATGNIYIYPNVANLSGVFKAQGTVYTCASAGGFNAGSVGSCGTQLSVQGALTGKQVELTRTFGTLLQAPNNPAETVIFSPEQWLSVLPGAGGGGGGSVITSNTYDSLVSLPPVL